MQPNLGRIKGREVLEMVIITLPAYNEESDIRQILEAIARAMKRNNLEYRVVVVDDGSTDNTAVIVNSLIGQLPLKLIQHDVNQGLGRALKTCLSYAAQNSTIEDIIVTMDADNTHSPELIIKMIRMVQDWYDVVIASRFRLDARVVGLSVPRRILSRAGSLLFQIFFPTKGLRDYTCGFRAYNAKALKQAFYTYGDLFVNKTGFSCTVDILLKLRRLDVRIAEVPLILRYDFKIGMSKMNVNKTIVDTLRLLIKRRFFGGQLRHLEKKRLQMLQDNSK